ncbi:MAG: ribosome biogenesis GTPase YlqF [Candidatus Gastranaerophilales bacterium]|nr:ribosome biogenesis GTPase YlqF [Candidatus Gastranaerophilales bacterium]
MKFIHWYPGHIAKAERRLKEQLNLVDVVVEVVDARIPVSSMYPEIKKLIGEKPRLIIMNKSDVADIDKAKPFVDAIQKETDCDIIFTSSKDNKDINKIVNKIADLSKPAITKLVQKGLLPRPARAMVIGMPNVGKSTVINKLIKKTKTKTGAKAGVTRQQQWVRINPRIDLLDTPGIIPVKQVEQEKALRLAFVDSIGENAYELESVAEEFLKLMHRLYPENIREKYGFAAEDDFTLENLAQKRNLLGQNSKPDTLRAASMLMNDFRDGRLGRLMLDE